jgi:hypothetical protein
MAFASLLVSVVLQTLINRRVEPLKKSKDKNQKKKHLAEAGKAPHDGEAVTTVDRHPFAWRENATAMTTS